MVSKNSIDIPIVERRELGTFLDELRNRKSIRLVKVSDEGLVEPARRGEAIVMQPRVRLVATAYDPEKQEIIRWQEKHDVGSGVVTIDAMGNKGHHRDHAGLQSKDDVIKELELEQYQVAPGEWTPETVKQIIERRQRNGK